MNRSRPAILAPAVNAISFALAALIAAEAWAGDPSPRPEAPAPSGRSRFLAAKTCFQTNVPYDPRIALAVDAVIVHRHGDRTESLRSAIGSWKDRGYVVGRMFFADSDATNAYWKGKWDGTPHPDEVERDEKGDVVLCAGVRPYMLPTEGWTRYLEEMARQSVDVGADAVLPEEPLAHAHTGYEEAFRKIWERRYGAPWEPEKASPSARFRTAQLKNELYLELERRLAAAVRARAAELGREVAFVLPVHGLYSNVAARLVAPIGTSTGKDWIDGWIGQVWTGPVNWALHHYGSPSKSFFASAYALYDSFDAIAAGSGKRLWMLVDPVEDDPRHEWAEFETWYRHCIVAMLLFPEVASYEVMPWPDRIFLPGYGTGGGTPAPERFRMVVLSAVQALQDVPAEVPAPGGKAPAGEIGVAVADTLLWEQEPFPPLDGSYGLLLPLIEAGVPVRGAVAERFGEKDYLAGRFRTVVLSLEAWKPAGPEAGEALAAWVRDGGSLVVLGGPDDLGGANLWWRDRGFPSPLHHLLSLLGAEVERDGDRAVGKGWVLRRTISPRAFADPAEARSTYLPLLDLAIRKAGGDGLRSPGHFLLRRGPFIVAHAGQGPLEVPGRLVDILEPELPVLAGARLAAGESGLYRDAAAGDGRGPRVLHATHRLLSERIEGDLLRIEVRGPEGTPAAVRIDPAGRKVRSAELRGDGGKTAAIEWKEDGGTGLARFPNDPAGVRLEILFN